jgi:hypothetical protein
LAHGSLQLHQLAQLFLPGCLHAALAVDGLEDLPLQHGGITILKVAGETVIIDITGQIDKFEKLLPKADKVLKTVEWEATS